MTLAMSRPTARRSPASRTPISDENLVERVAQLRADARCKGERVPGRSALVAALASFNVNEYRVRVALAEVIRLDQARVRQSPAGDQSSADLAPGLPGQSLTLAGDGVHQPAPSAHPLPGDPDGRPAKLAPDGASGVMPADARKDAAPVWPLVLIGLAAAVSVWSGWVGLGRLAGFGMVQPLPGIWDNLHLNSAVVLPISVEAYAAYALRCWLTSRCVPDTARRFAMCSAIVSLTIGAVAQVAYHLMSAAGMTHAPWPVTVGVATVPVLVLGLATALANLIRTGSA